MKTEARWVMPVVILSMAFMVLLAFVSWMQVVFGSPMLESGGRPGMESQMLDMDQMMGGGMMLNIADISKDTEAGMPDCDMKDGKSMEEMHQDPEHKVEHDKCEKTMGGDHDKMHEQMHGKTSEESI